MKPKCKIVFNMILILLGGGIFGTFLLVMVYLIPLEPIFYNFSTGVEGLNRNKGWYQLVFDYDASMIDEVTESLMIKAAATPLPPSDENIVQYALRGYTLNEKEAQHGLKFYEYIWKGKKYTCDSYERYWHGYLVILKPMMWLFSFHDIIFINIATQSALMFFVLVMLRKKEVPQLQLPFVILWIICMQIVVMFSMDYSSCFYIYLLTVLVLLLCKKARERYWYVFLISGMLTSFMDFLTWPLITLGVPLTVLLFIENNELWKKNLYRVIYSSMAWGIGYIGQWAFKWVIASFFLKENILGDAFTELVFRISSVNEISGNELSYLQVIKKNIGVFMKKPYILIFICVIGVMTIVFLKRKKDICIYKVIPFLVVMLFPFLWFFVVKNHSYMHYWMTWRNLTITVFAFICGLFACVNTTSVSNKM